MEIEKVGSEADILWTQFLAWFEQLDPVQITLLLGTVVLFWVMLRIKRARKRRCRELPWGITRVD